MHLPPLPQRQLAATRFAVRNSTTSSPHTRRYSPRQLLVPEPSYRTRTFGNQDGKRGCVLQYPYRASRPAQFSPSVFQSFAPVHFRNCSHHSDFSLPSWRAWLLSRGLFRSTDMASNTLNPNSQERRPSAVRQASVASDNKTRQQVLQKQLRATQFTAMVTNSVNKTALHPGGVEYVPATSLNVQH